MKNVVGIVSTFCLFIALMFGGAGEVLADNVHQELSTHQIQEKLDEINSRYKVGEAFLEEDAIFVKKYVKTLSSDSDIQLLDIHTTYSGSYGSVNGVGFIKADAGPLQITYNGSIEIWDHISKHDLGAEVAITCYGIIGQDGFGVIYNKTFSDSSKNTNLVRFDFSDDIYGIGLVITHSFKGTVGKNSFTLKQN